MNFRHELLARARRAGGRVVFAEGEDPRVQEAAARLRREGILEPVLLGGPGGIDPATDSRRQRVAQRLRDRRPDKVHDVLRAAL